MQKSTWQRAPGWVVVILVWGASACFAGSDRRERVPTPATDEVSVLTYNVFGYPLLAFLQRPRRFSRIKQELREDLGTVDAILVQEAFIDDAQVLREAREHVLVGACGDRSFNPTGLLMMSDHRFLEEPTRYSFERDDHRRWRLVAESELDCEVLRAGRRVRKGVLFGSLVTERGVVDLVNVHLSTKEADREIQKRLLVEAIERRTSQRPIILGGDFNEDTCRSMTAALTGKELSFVDASCGVGPTVGGLRWGLMQGAWFAGEIDRVMTAGMAATDKRFRLFSHPRRRGHLSDHDGVLTYLRWVSGEDSPR